jgi:hypothetical protein
MEGHVKRLYLSPLQRLRMVAQFSIAQIRSKLPEKPMRKKRERRKSLKLKNSLRNLRGYVLRKRRISCLLRGQIDKSGISWREYELERKKEETAKRIQRRKDATQEKLEQQQAEKQLKGEAKARKIVTPKTKGSKKAQMKELVVAEEEVAQTSSPRPRRTQQLPARFLDDVVYID